MNFTYRTVTVSGRPFHAVPLFITAPSRGPATPAGKPAGLGWSVFARRYSRNLC